MVDTPDSACLEEKLKKTEIAVDIEKQERVMHLVTQCTA
jgi:hypothetical protein